MRSFLCLLVLVSMAAAAAAQTNGAAIRGEVRDQSGGVLPGATVTVRTVRGQLVAHTMTDETGAYAVVTLPPGTYTVDVSMPNFATSRSGTIGLRDGESTRLQSVLRLTMTADVTVTGKRTFRNLAEMGSHEGGLIGVADAASEGVVTGRQVEMRPIMRSGELLETVPGLVISQHSGEGKANQYYLRGFNLDHGTDFFTDVAGVPVNMPTHAHGHGYADLNFLIPELVSGVQFRKGPYSAEEGDFSTAGASHIRYTNTLDRPIADLSAGGGGWRRFIAAASPKIGNGHLLVALEASHNDGPWVRPDDYDKLNGVVRFSTGDLRNGYSVTAMGYSGRWNSTDQVPARAMTPGALGRFGGVDQTDGGRTARFSLSGDWQRTTSAAVTRASAYVMRYRLNLFSNFTYFLDDPERGDQFEQADRRIVSGGRIIHRRSLLMAGRPAEFALGADLRRDDIGEVSLFHTARRVRLDATRDDAVVQTSAGGFAQHEAQWTSWLRTNVGLRADRFHFDVDAREPVNSGRADAGVFGPKATVILGPWKSAEVYLNTGYGFHSNDARGTTMTVDPATGGRVSPLVRAHGAEVGLRAMPMRRMQVTLALWRLGLDSELVFVGDAGTTEAGRASLRYGVEGDVYFTAASWLTLDGNLALTRGRFRAADPAGDRIPGALGRVVSGGVTIDGRSRISGSLRLRHFGPRSLIEDGSVRSAPTTIVNGQIAIPLSRRARLVVDAFNLLDSMVSDIDYFYTSRLPGEPADGVADVHSHPVPPRTLRVGIRTSF